MSLYAEAEKLKPGLEQYFGAGGLSFHFFSIPELKNNALKLKRILNRINKEVPKGIRDELFELGELENLAKNSLLLHAVIRP